MASTSMERALRKEREAKKAEDRKRSAAARAGDTVAIVQRLADQLGTGVSEASERLVVREVLDTIGKAIFAGEVRDAHVTYLAASELTVEIVNYERSGAVISVQIKRTEPMAP